MNIDLNAPIWGIDHVAAALGGLHTDTAREHTYSPRSPGPRLREDVLDWFASLPTADRSRPERRKHGSRTRHAATAPQAARQDGSEGMSRAGHTPIESIGGVDIYTPPTSGKSLYYRLGWSDLVGPPLSTSGGKTFEGARLKAQHIAQRLGRADSPHSVATLSQLIEDYIANGRSATTGQSWAKGYKDQVQDQLLRSAEGFEDRCAMDVDRDLLDSMRAQAGTDRMVKQNTTAWRGLLRWGDRHPDKYFTADQAELLPAEGMTPIPTLATGRTMPKHKSRTRAVGQHDDYIQDSDAPDADQVRTLNRYYRSGDDSRQNAAEKMTRRRSA